MKQFSPLICQKISRLISNKILRARAGVLQGEIWAILDDSEVCLKAGDVMVQRGTTHSWSVRTDEPCLLVAILVDAEPI